MCPTVVYACTRTFPTLRYDSDSSLSSAACFSSKRVEVSWKVACYSCMCKVGHFLFIRATATVPTAHHRWCSILSERSDLSKTNTYQRSSQIVSCMGVLLVRVSGTPHHIPINTNSHYLCHYRHFLKQDFLLYEYCQSFQEQLRIMNTHIHPRTHSHTLTFSHTDTGYH